MWLNTGTRTVKDPFPEIAYFFRNSGNKLNVLESFRQRSKLNVWSKTFPQSWLKEPIPHYEVKTSKK